MEPIFGVLLATAGYAGKALIDWLVKRFQQAREEKRGVESELDKLRTRNYKLREYVYRLRIIIIRLGEEPPKWPEGVEEVVDGRSDHEGNHSE